MRVVLLVCGCLLSTLGSAGAQAQAAPLQAAASASSSAASAPSAAARAAAAPHLQVIEDDAVRIEELRVRGQPQRITVHSKVAGARPYEILVGPAGRDPSQDRGAHGRRTWSLVDF